MRALFATAVEDGVLRSNPASVVRIASADRTATSARRALTRVELAGLLGEVPTEWRLFFEFLTHTGLRISEAVALRWDDIDLGQQPKLSVRRQLYRGALKPPKSRYGIRTIPLAAGMAARLAEVRPADELGPVFASASGGYIDAANVRHRVLQPAARRAGLSHVGFHTLRHTCASLLFDGGKNVKQVQEWLGHHDPGFTLRTYVHLIDEGLGAAEFLDDVVRSPAAPTTPLPSDPLRTVLSARSLTQA